MGDGGGGGGGGGGERGSIIHHLMPAPVLAKWRVRIQRTKQINDVHGCLKVRKTGNVFFSFFSSEVIRHSFAPSTEV